MTSVKIHLKRFLHLGEVLNGVTFADFLHIFHFEHPSTSTQAAVWRDFSTALDNEDQFKELVFWLLEVVANRVVPGSLASKPLPALELISHNLIQVN